MKAYSYCNSLTTFSRFKTRIVNIGDVPLGGNSPIRIQSMTSTPTLDTIKTVEQSIRMIEAGCEFVRIATPGLREVENLKNIKDELGKKGYSTPIIADIHFNPKAAELAAAIVEKVRINPGNYADKKQIASIEYSDNEYQAELERISNRVKPLIEICKANGTVMRVGSNHGSLSDRIKNRYGDTPLGMVESALEFIRICEYFNFQDIVVSMKSSNIKITVEATRLLINKMMAEQMNYPVHLGVTEAGEGEDGRIKSAAGIGSLLTDGIGDTIRVSLTEDPEKEIPVARTLLQHYAHDSQKQTKVVRNLPYDPFQYNRRKTLAIGDIGGSNPPVVITDSNDLTFPYLLLNVRTFNERFENASSKGKSWMLQKDMEKFRSKPGVLVLEEMEKFNLYDFRKAFYLLMQHSIKAPVIIKVSYKSLSREEFQLYSSADISSLHVDGFGDGIWICADENIPKDQIKQTALNILQANGTRISKTEFISCPSCSRTTYDIQKTAAQIRAKTSHLIGLKIGIMGCVVNGPGEMADAHYGYVGSGKEKVSLYKGKECVRKNIDAKDAVDALVDLIKSEGDWVEPQ